MDMSYSAEEKEDILVYIQKNRSGDLNDLISKYGKDKVEGLCLTGFIHQGLDGD
jgi:hypothetical protein